MMPTSGVTSQENGRHVNMVNALVWIHSLTVLLGTLSIGLNSQHNTQLMYLHT